MDEARTAFLAHEALAVVGVSRTRGFGNAIVKELSSRGWRVHPVSLTADVVEGRPCVRRLDDLPEPVGAVVAVVPPSAVGQVVDDCARLGIRHLWMQQGAESDEAIERALAAGIQVVHHACVLMYARPKGIHNFHAWIWKKIGRY